MDKISLWSNATNITTAKTIRRTVDNRRLTYQLHVLQQPERARACGNGAKASADRRPVDPPPVVELRVFEGEDDNNLKDITISYHNVNFFLFATLEARPIAAGRVGAPGPPSMAVLNGCNVAGINYLERPAPAGYFIFPDLSVRHEGFYRLTFALYEQVKDWRDADPERPFPPAGLDKSLEKEGQRPPQMHNSSVSRLEVRSEEFQVFSAKKFPGLDRSTGLSIGLSDQGCRVRIRRDVRMRKRPKPKLMNEPYGDDAMRGRYTTPEGMPMPHDRPRSLSHGSHDGSQYGERRLSVHSGDMYGRPQQPPISLGPSSSSFAVPTTPSSAMPPSSAYPQHHYPSLPSPSGPAPSSRLQDYTSKPAPYRPYEHRGSDASTYSNSDAGSRRPSDVTSYPPRPTEPSSYRRPSDPSAYVVSDPSSYRTQQAPAYPAAHYSYTSSGNKVTIAPEQPMLPPVSDLIRDADTRQDALQATGKRTYSPPRFSHHPLKSGMRPSAEQNYDEPYSSFPGMLEYKRANGGLSHAPLDRRGY